MLDLRDNVTNDHYLAIMPHRSTKICLIGRGGWVFKGF